MACTEGATVKAAAKAISLFDNMMLITRDTLSLSVLNSSRSISLKRCVLRVKRTMLLLIDY